MAASIVGSSLSAIFTKSEWKTARVTPVFKMGVKSDLNDYRPISITPVISIVSEKIVYDQLHQCLAYLKLLNFSLSLSLHVWVDRAWTVDLVYQFMRTTAMCAFVRKATQEVFAKQVRRR